MDLKERLEQAKQELNDLRTAYRMTLAGQSWSTKDGESSRSVTNVSLSTLAEEIRKKECEVMNLENRINRTTGKAFRGRVIW